MLSRFLKDRNGATAVEYGLLIALLGLVIISSVTALGANLSTEFVRVAKTVDDGGGGGGGGGAAVVARGGRPAVPARGGGGGVVVVVVVVSVSGGV